MLVTLLCTDNLFNNTYQKGRLKRVSLFCIYIRITFFQIDIKDILIVNWPISLSWRLNEIR